MWGVELGNFIPSDDSCVGTAEDTSEVVGATDYGCWLVSVVFCSSLTARVYLSLTSLTDSSLYPCTSKYCFATWSVPAALPTRNELPTLTALSINGT